MAKIEKENSSLDELHLLGQGNYLDNDEGQDYNLDELHAVLMSRGFNEFDKKIGYFLNLDPDSPEIVKLGVNLENSLDKLVVLAKFLVFNVPWSDELLNNDEAATSVTPSLTKYDSIQDEEIPAIGIIDYKDNSSTQL